MRLATKMILACAPVAFFLGMIVWAFTTGTYASDRDRMLPYLFAGIAFVYMLPSIIASRRDHSQFLVLWLVNVFGTPLFFIGWVASLIWAFIDPKRRVQTQPSSSTTIARQ